MINELPSRYEDILIPLFNINSKFVLGGSLALYVLDIMEYDFKSRVPDFDLGLKESITEDELITIRDFWNLEFSLNTGDYSTDNTEGLSTTNFKIKPISYFLTKDLIQLEKNTELEQYKIDIFNSSFIKPKDIVHVPYKEYTLHLTHPSIILSHKSKYAYDTRVGKQYKHFEDIQKIDWKKYFSICKKINYVWDKEYKTISNSVFSVS